MTDVERLSFSGPAEPRNLAAIYSWGRSQGGRAQRGRRDEGNEDPIVKFREMNITGGEKVNPLAMWPSVWKDGNRI